MYSHSAAAGRALYNIHPGRNGTLEKMMDI